MTSQAYNPFNEFNPKPNHTKTIEEEVALILHNINLVTQIDQLHNITEYKYH